MKLPTTTRARLALYRKRAADNKHGRNDWRGHRYEKGCVIGWHNWNDDRTKLYADERGTLGDYLGDWGEFAAGRTLRDTTGFYVDGWCSETLQGGVERIRTPRGCLYVPVTYCTGWDGVTYYMGDAESVPKGAGELQHEEAQRAAAFYAFDRAEREAEQYREDNAKQQAEDDITAAREEIHGINKEARALLAEIRGREFTENVCAALRHRLQEYLVDRRRLFKTIAEREQNYWSAVPC